jgi:hypothetical protein
MTRSTALRSLRPHLPAAIVAATLLASIAFHLHWSVSVGVSILAILWFVIAGNARVPRIHYVGIAVGIGCILLLQLAPLSAVSERIVSWTLLAVLAVLLLSAAWQPIAALVSAQREILDIRREVRSLRHRRGEE